MLGTIAAPVRDINARACASDPEAMFPTSAGGGGGQKGEDWQHARNLCRSCPVLDACYRAALENPLLTEHGVIAGMSSRDWAFHRRALVDANLPKPRLGRTR